MNLQLKNKTVYAKKVDDFTKALQGTNVAYLELASKLSSQSAVIVLKKIDEIHLGFPVRFNSLIKKRARNAPKSSLLNFQFYLRCLLFVRLSNCQAVLTKDYV